MSKKLKQLKKQENIENNDNNTCCLKFSQCDDNKYQLWTLDVGQLKQFVTFAKKIENMRWIDIFQTKSFNYESIKNLKVPDYLSKDMVLKSIRVNQKFRIYGYRMNSDFYIVWFDPRHELT